MTAQQLPEEAVEELQERLAKSAYEAARPSDWPAWADLSERWKRVERNRVRAFLSALSPSDLLSLAAERIGDEEREELIERLAESAYEALRPGDWAAWADLSERWKQVERKRAQAFLAALLPGEPRD